MQLDRLGRPVDWTVSQVLAADWGTVRVFAGSALAGMVDVTYFRGVQTQVKSWSYVEPFGYGPAEISFPQISPYDSLGTGDLSWFVQGMDINLVRLQPDGSTQVPLWEGFAASWEPEQTDTGYEFGLHLQGALHQATLEPHPPSWLHRRVDIGVSIGEALNRVPGRRYGELPFTLTNITTRNRGSWQTVLDYVQELLSTAYNRDATKQWTLSCGPGRQPRLHVKDVETQHWTVSMGAPGVLLRETSDITATVNVIYGEGIDDENGCRWRNTRYPTAYDRPVFVPLVGVSQNMPYIYDDEAKRDGDGVGWDVNPNYDPRRLRVARYENFGNGLTLQQGKESALAELKRDVNPGWQGTLELTSDPEEGCKLDIRAGQNIGVRHHHGHPVRLFHISQVDVAVDDPGFKVTLTVDTNGRDNVTVAGIRARDKEAATDPARRLNPPRRRARQTMDEHPVFDCESGAGQFPAWPVTGGTWNVRRVPFAAWGSIVRTYFETSPPTTYAAGVFGRPITRSSLDAHVGNPLASEDPWDRDADQLSEYVHEAGTLPYVNADAMTKTEAQRLIGEGWYGDPEDRMEALYPPDVGNPYVLVTALTAAEADRLRSAGWTDDPNDGLEALYPPPHHPTGTGHHLQVAWGSSNQRGGYYPGQQDKGSPVTGRMLDDAQWDYISSQPPWVWLAFYPAGSTTLTGRFFNAPDA